MTLLLSRQNKTGTTIVSRYDYTVNAIGQRTDVAQAGTAFAAARSITWGYDSLGQVTSADSIAQGQTLCGEFAGKSIPTGIGVEIEGGFRDEWGNLPFVGLSVRRAKTNLQKQTPLPSHHQLLGEGLRFAAWAKIPQGRCRAVR
ncbi:MAG: hypothetical protein ACSHX7_14250 [Luteolibacter sp.]